MPDEKKLWPKLRSPFRLALGTEAQASGHNTRGTHDASAQGNNILPEPVNIPLAAALEPCHTSRTNSLSAEVSSGSEYNHDVDCYFFRTTGSPGTAPSSCLYSGRATHSEKLKRLSRTTPSLVSRDASQQSELEQRLDSAYDRIRALPSPLSPQAISLPADLRTLHKQLGVPQHSVTNAPSESFPPLPNPHIDSHPQPLACGLSPSKKLHTDANWIGTSSQNYSNLNSEPPGNRLSSLNRPTLHIDTDVYADCNRASVTQRSRRSLPLIVGLTTGAIDRGATTTDSHSDPLFQPNIAAYENTISPQDRVFQQKPSKLTKRRPVSRRPSSLSPSPVYSHCVPKHGRLMNKIEVEADSNMDGSKELGPLPPIRTSSPFRVDVPIHQPWRERQTTFDLSEGLHRLPTSVSFPESQLRRTAISTGALASLAWIGAPTLSGFSTSSAEVRGCLATENGRFSIEMVVDDNVPDEVLVDQLEEFRRTCSLSEHWSQNRSRTTDNRHSSFLASSSDQDESTAPITASRSPRPLTIHHAALCSPIGTTLTPDDDDAAIWQAARKALLCVREIVRTERRYQEALKMLSNAQTTTPPPPFMLPFISDLIRASEMLLNGFLDDPSAWGVSTTFMACEDDVEAAMVPWCSVAGSFFTDRNETASGLQVARRGFRRSGVALSANRGSVSGVRPSTDMISQSPQSPPTLTLLGIADSRMEHGKWQRTGEGWRLSCGKEVKIQQSQNETPANVTMSKQPLMANEVKIENGQSVRRASVRDLAIQPIQRVMRYVLLYRDLLEYTPPTSPSRALVERALEAATRIASKCNRAQSHAAFLRSRT